MFKLEVGSKQWAEGGRWMRQGMVVGKGGRMKEIRSVQEVCIYRQEVGIESDLLIPESPRYSSDIKCYAAGICPGLGRVAV